MINCSDKHCLSFLDLESQLTSKLALNVVDDNVSK